MKFARNRCVVDDIEMRERIDHSSWSGLDKHNSCLRIFYQKRQGKAVELSLISKCGIPRPETIQIKVKIQPWHSNQFSFF